MRTRVRRSAGRPGGREAAEDDVGHRRAARGRGGARPRVRARVRASGDGSWLAEGRGAVVRVSPFFSGLLKMFPFLVVEKHHRFGA